MLQPPPATTPTIAAAAALRIAVPYIQPPAGQREPRHIRMRPDSGAARSPAFTRAARFSGAESPAISRSVSSPALWDSGRCESRRWASEESPLFGRVFIAHSWSAGAGQPSGYGLGRAVNVRWIR